LNEIDISSTEDLIREINNLPNNYIYRGHASYDWKLQSTLERMLGSKWDAATVNKFERYALERFQPKFHLYDKENGSPQSKLAWLSILQHYGAPTRLLDFSESPYVALYFALEDYQPQLENDLALFALDYTALMDRSIDFIKKNDSKFTESLQTVASHQDEVFENIVDRFSYEIAWVTEPTKLNVRLDRQSGCFLVSGNKGSRITQLLDSDLYNGCDFRKYRIDRDLYTGLFALLRKVNLTSKNIYGDLQGLARSIRMELQVYAF